VEADPKLARRLLVFLTKRVRDLDRRLFD